MPDTIDMSANFSIVLYGPDKMARIVADDWLVSLAPPAGSEHHLVVWEQPENGYGLLSLRGPNGYPPVTGVPGWRRMSMAPAYYGEKVLVTEREMNEQREHGTANEPMNMEKRIGYIQDEVLKRAFDRMRLINATLFSSGRYSVTDDAGKVQHADTLDGYAARNVFTPAISWSLSPATAKPIDDLQSWQAQLMLGTDSTFDESTEIGCSTPTINYILQTTQIRSQLKIDYGATAVGLSKLNGILKEANLPAIRRVDEDYYATAAAAKARTGAIRFLPAGTLIWKGKRKDGAIPAQFQLTRSATRHPPAGVAQNAPGYEFSPAGRSQLAAEFAQALYTIVQYQLVPAEYQIDIGFNGGVAVPYASCFAGIINV